MSSQIRVFVRCKPPSSRNFISLGSKSKSISIDDKAFQFDQVFDEDTSQEHIFLTCAKEIVGNCFQGYNGTIFAYGQTVSLVFTYRSTYIQFDLYLVTVGKWKDSFNHWRFKRIYRESWYHSKCN